MISNAADKRKQMGVACEVVLTRLSADWGTPGRYNLRTCVHAYVVGIICVPNLRTKIRVQRGILRTVICVRYRYNLRTKKRVSESV